MYTYTPLNKGVRYGISGIKADSLRGVRSNIRRIVAQSWSWQASLLRPAVQAEGGQCPSLQTEQPDKIEGRVIPDMRHMWGGIYRGRAQAESVDVFGQMQRGAPELCTTPKNRREAPAGKARVRNLRNAISATSNSAASCKVLLAQMCGSGVSKTQGIAKRHTSVGCEIDEQVLEGRRRRCYSEGQRQVSVVRGVGCAPWGASFVSSDRCGAQRPQSGKSDYSLRQMSQLLSRFQNWADWWRCRNLQFILPKNRHQVSEGCSYV